MKILPSIFLLSNEYVLDWNTNEDDADKQVREEMPGFWFFTCFHNGDEDRGNHIVDGKEEMNLTK